MNTTPTTISYTKTTLGLFGGILLAIIAYVYFLNNAVVDVVLQKEAFQSAQEIKNDIALLESDYITAQHTIAARMATHEQLTVDTAKVFVTRDTADNLVLNR